jgi:phosphatidylglycerol lysyltransferase
MDSATIVRPGAAAPRPRLASRSIRRLGEAELLEQFAYQFGRSYDSYLVTDPDRCCFWASGRRGVVVYAKVGKYLHVGGGILAHTSDKQQLLAEFIEFAQRRKQLISFYNIPGDELPLFRKFGFQVTKWGEDALLELRGRTWRGNEFQWVRRQSNYCLRRGLTVLESSRGKCRSADWSNLVAELEEISAARLATKPQAAETAFLDGRFEPSRLGRRRLFIARSSQRIEAFLICNPYLNGRQWALEVYRHRPDCIRGTMAFLMHQTLNQLQREGVRRASLCLIPGLRCERPLEGDSRLIRWGLLLSQRLNLIFDHAGLYHFKSRFRPRFENRYVCVLPKATVGSLLTFTQLCGVLRLSPRKLLREIFFRVTNSSGRTTLARPTSSPAG